jgi:tetratricopeptide (TPR) repeat protein
MTQGYVLTAYFYGTLKAFESDPASLKDSIGEMVYGMDVDTTIRQIKNIQFAAEGSQDVLTRVPRQLRGLDLAELKLMQGDTAAAGDLAQQALTQHTADPARANFILARCAILNRNTQAAVDGFEEAIQTSKDPRLLAWSHIYLGRIYDINDRRDEAVEEYKAALTVRDGQADTRKAAESGLKAPWAVPNRPPGTESAPADAKP